MCCCLTKHQSLPLWWATLSSMLTRPVTRMQRVPFTRSPLSVGRLWTSSGHRLTHILAGILHGDRQRRGEQTKPCQMTEGTNPLLLWQGQDHAVSSEHGTCPPVCLLFLFLLSLNFPFSLSVIHIYLFRAAGFCLGCAGESLGGVLQIDTGAWPSNTYFDLIGWGGALVLVFCKCPCDESTMHQGLGDTDLKW